MRKHDDARRAFLIGAAAGAGAAAGVAFDAFAQAPEQHKPTDAPATDAQATAHVHTALLCGLRAGTPRRRPDFVFTHPGYIAGTTACYSSEPGLLR